MPRVQEGKLHGGSNGGCHGVAVPSTSCVFDDGGTSWDTGLLLFEMHDSNDEIQNDLSRLA